MSMDVHAIGNAVETGVWWILATVLLGAGLRNRNYLRHSIMAAFVLLAFGLSDVVEIQTGAWWRPWWLLLWKALCLLAMFILWWRRPLR